MDKISRRKFIERLLVYNTTILLGGSLFAACSKDFLDNDTDGVTGATTAGNLKYVPIQTGNPAISRWPDKCKQCGECIEACAEKQKVFGTYNATSSKHVCIHCGTCVITCEKNALTEKYNWQDVLKAIDDPTKVVIASTSPSVRIGIGDYFGMTTGSFLLENLVGSCRAVGFDYVLDTNFSADLTIMEEAGELQKRITENANMPQFTSCCPAWIKYVEIYYPSLLKHISTVRSPIGMQGAMVKSYFAQKKGIDPKNIIHVAITPYTAKKYEIGRSELTTDGMRSTDLVITTNELAIMLKQRNINLSSQKGSFDTLMGAASGGGIIFGNTGGVTRAAIRTAYFNITGSNPPANLMELKEVQGLTGLKSATVNIGNIALKVAVCYQMANAKTLLDQVKNGTCQYDFIEVMACKGGCVGGAGQKAGSTTIDKRITSLNSADIQSATRYSHENPEIISIYRDFLGEVGGVKAKQYIHTTYFNKSSEII